MDGAAAISATGVSKRYGSIEALNDVTVAIDGLATGRGQALGLSAGHGRTLARRSRARLGGARLGRDGRGLLLAFRRWCRLRRAARRSKCRSEASTPRGWGPIDAIVGSLKQLICF